MSTQRCRACHLRKGAPAILGSTPPCPRSAAAPGPDRAGAAQGEKYVNPGKVETESQVANNAGKIGGDWKPNSPPKKKCAPASAHTTQTLPLARASA